MAKHKKELPPMRLTARGELVKNILIITALILATGFCGWVEGLPL